jgi:RHS repeat-associated protein
LKGSTTLESFSYDALGHRITITASGTTTSLYYSDQDQFFEGQVSGATQNQYVWSPVYVNALNERDSGSQRLYVKQDANWNVTALVDTSGNVVERYVYDPCGTITILAPNWTTRSSSSYTWIYLFQGGRLDTIAGLVQFQNRDYSPTLFRWMENDPLGFGGGDTNLYRADGGNPAGGVDPTGLTATIATLEGNGTFTGIGSVTTLEGNGISVTGFMDLSSSDDAQQPVYKSWEDFPYFNLPLLGYWGYEWGHEWTRSWEIERQAQAIDDSRYKNGQTDILERAMKAKGGPDSSAWKLRNDTYDPSAQSRRDLSIDPIKLMATIGMLWDANAGMWVSSSGVRFQFDSALGKYKNAKTGEAASAQESAAIQRAEAQLKAARGVKLTRGGQRAIGGLADMKDMRLADAIRERGGGQSQIQLLDNPPGGESVAQMTVGDIANAAAQREEWAVQALKMLKQAGSQGKDGK